MGVKFFVQTCFVFIKRFIDVSLITPQKEIPNRLGITRYDILTQVGWIVNTCFSIQSISLTEKLSGGKLGE